MLRKIIPTATIALLSISAFASDEIIPLDYNGFKITYNCTKRGYDYYEYQTVRDTNNLPRVEKFHDEKRLPKRCQQTSTGTYKTAKTVKDKYDRGHGAPANHLDYSKKLVWESNSMANVLPHSRKLNRTGLWRMTDKVIECTRDTSGGVYVYGGVIWGTDKTNDYFLKSHGVETPDYLFKIIIKTNGEHQAWIMPNNDEPTFANRDKYLVTVKEIEERTGYSFKKVKDKNSKAIRSWTPQKYCDLS